MCPMCGPAAAFLSARSAADRTAVSPTAMATSSVETRVTGTSPNGDGPGGADLPRPGSGDCTKFRAATVRERLVASVWWGRHSCLPRVRPGRQECLPHQNPNWRITERLAPHPLPDGRGSDRDGFAD